MADPRPSLTPALTQAALERTRPLWRAMHPADLVRMNVDVPRAVGIVLRTLERLEARLPELRTLLGDEGLDEVRDLALAALHAHLVWHAPPPERLDAERADAERRALFAEAIEMRAALADQARVLARRPWVLLPPDEVRRLDLGRGRESLPRDLNDLVRLFRAHWPALALKTPLTEAHLARVDRLISLLPKALAEARHPEKKRVEEADARVRTFSLLVVRYQRLRDAVAFLRSGKGGARQLAPALYAGPGSRPKRAEATAKARASEETRAKVKPASEAPAVDATGVSEETEEPRAPTPATSAPVSRGRRRRRRSAGRSAISPRLASRACSPPSSAGGHDGAALGGARGSDAEDDLPSNLGA